MTMPNDFKFDSRIRQRMLRRGDLTAAELQAHVESLADLSGEYEDLNEFTQPALVPARADACEPSPAFDPRRLGGVSSAAASSSYLPSKTAAQAARPAPRPLSPLIPSPSAAERARSAPAFSGLDEARRAPPPVVTRVAPAAVEAALGPDGIPSPAVLERRAGEGAGESEPHTPVTLRSDQAVAKPGALDDEDEDEDDDDDLDEDDDDDDDVDDLENEDESPESDDEDDEDDDDDDDDDDVEGSGEDDDEEPPTNPRGGQ